MIRIINEFCLYFLYAAVFTSFAIRIYEEFTEGWICGLILLITFMVGWTGLRYLLDHKIEIDIRVHDK